MPKGSKTCSNCGLQTGPRAYICSQCKTPFDFAVKTKRSRTTKFIKNFNWKDLERNQVVKVTGGPYYLTSDGEYIPMGYRGVFKVEDVSHNGIIGFNKKSGYVHIYMGKDYQSEDTRIFKTAHRMILLKKKEKK